MLWFSRCNWLKTELDGEILNFLFHTGLWSRLEKMETLMGFTHDPLSLFSNLSPLPEWHQSRWLNVSFLSLTLPSHLPFVLYSLNLKKQLHLIFHDAVYFAVYSAPLWVGGGRYTGAVTVVPRYGFCNNVPNRHNRELYFPQHIKPV